MPLPLLDIALFAAYLATSASGLLLLKRAMTRLAAAGTPLQTLSPDTAMFAAGTVLYVVSFGLWLRILARLPLSTAYPIAIGLTMAAAAAGAVLVLGERLSPLKLAGMALVFAGCLALSLDSK